MEPARHLRAVARRSRESRRSASAHGESILKRSPLDGENALEIGLGLLIELARRIAPASVEEVAAEVAAKLARVPTELNEYGYDPWGFHPRSFERALVLSALLYRHYFRVETSGVEHLPTGRFLLIANHAGQLPLDAAMLMCGTVLDADPPRLLRGMAEYWMQTLPWIGTMGVRSGSVVGTPKNCVDLLRREEAVVAFPEGVRGLNKLYAQRYRLQDFGLGFMRLALETDSPIVPTVVIGSEEQAPALANIGFLARLIGAPAFPITPFFPLLGPLGALPLPVRYFIHVGEPMSFTGSPHDEDSVIEEKVAEVKARMRAMIERGLRERRSVFL